MTGPRFLAITGATASGKTALSMAIADRLPVEIVSMDSRQVYRGMDVGTDKVGPDERAHVPHHGLDLVKPDERYSAGRFARDVRRWVREIEGRGALPILAGGTGFFLRAVIDPIFAEPPLDAARLEALRAYLAGQSREMLEAWVRALDPDRAAVAIQGGPQRMARTLEVALLTGVPLSRWHTDAPKEADGLPGVVIVLDLPKEEMDRRIDQRVAGMVDRGLVDEVHELTAAGYGDDDPGMTGTGYREITAHLRGELSLEEAVEAIRRSTRRYARRQLTWFRTQLPESTVHIDATLPRAEQVELIFDAMRAGGLVVPEPQKSEQLRP